MKIRILIFLSLIYFFVFIPQAQAYIDPGTGSMLVQAIVAGFLGFSIFWKQIKTKIFIMKKKASDESKKENKQQTDAE